MRIVCTSDTHFAFSADKIPDGDVFIHAGDLMYTGYFDEWHSRVESLAALPHKVKLFVPGNHDLHVQNYTGPANQDLRKAGVRMLGTHPNHMAYKLENGKVVLGLPFVTNLPGWAYNRTEEELEAMVPYLPRADMVVSHSPPAGILDNGYGAKAWLMYLMNQRPEHWLVGHIHESYGEDARRGCNFYNACMCDRAYAQSNKPIVFDLD